MTKSAAEVLKRSPKLISRKNNDGTVAVMSIESDDCIFSLDGIAAEFWMLIDGKRSVEKICKDLIKKHDPPLARFEKDVQKLIKSLRDARLIG